MLTSVRCNNDVITFCIVLQVATSKVSERTAKSKDEKELEQLGADAFKPTLVSTPEGRRIRSSAPSSGYVRLAVMQAVLRAVLRASLRAS